MLFAFVACVFLLCCANVSHVRMSVARCVRARVRVSCRVYFHCVVCVCARACVYMWYTHTHAPTNNTEKRTRAKIHTTRFFVRTHSACHTPAGIYAPNACEHTRAGTLVCTHTYNTARHTHTTHAHITKLEHTHAFTHQRKRSFSTTSRPNTAF